MSRFYIILSILFIKSISGMIVSQMHNEIDLSRDRFKSFDNLFQTTSSNFLREVFHDQEDKCEIRPHGSAADYYYFLPSLKAVLKPGREKDEFANGCFKSNVFVLEKFTKEETIISIESSNSKSLLCKDNYLISTTNIHEIKFVVLKGMHKVVLKNLSQDDYDEILVNGINIFTFCQDFFTSMKSLFDSLELYIGGLGKNPGSWLPFLKPSVPEYMEKANIDFLERFANFKPLHRGKYAGEILNFDQSEIKTGDFIAIYRLDGLDPLIMLGSGSHVGHSAVAVWIDGELYITESQDGWYWPKRGIQRNKFSQWVEWAHNADFNVAILPLKEELRAKLDEKKAIDWFKSVEGLNYGYHNFLFSWLDTPHDNLPRIIDHEAIFLLFTVLEKISKTTADTIIGEALNMRINTKGLSIPQVAAQAARKGLTTNELLALPEKEGWQYSDGLNYVCSCFVIGFYKAGGLFGDLEIMSTEFTPKDVYQLNFFDRSYKDRRPNICKDADPELEYCQIMGKYQVSLPGYSSIEPYSHMNEKCPSIAPDFFRPNDC